MDSLVRSASNGREPLLARRAHTNECSYYCSQIFNMILIPDNLRLRLQRYGQEHLLDVVECLDEAERVSFLGELNRIDLAELAALHARREHKDALPERHRVKPLPAPALDTAQREVFKARGQQAFRRGEVAF